MALAVRFDLAPARAVEFFRGKGLKASFAWQDMLHEEHDRAFTVAKMLDLDLLSDVRDQVERAISEGRTFQQFQDELAPELARRGWWGEGQMKDPATGELREVQLGSPRRLRVIYDTNLRTAYASGDWARIRENAATAPYVMYSAILDSRTRPQHRAWHGKVLRADDPWWKTHTPPNGWNSLLPDQRVSGLAYLGLKAKYAGKIVEVRGHSGGRFAVTAQHPVLTTRGWVDAQALREGDELVAYRPEVRGQAMTAQTHEHDAPPTIEEVFETLARGARATAPRATLDLHGEEHFVESDVEVVAADRALLRHLQSAAREFIGKLALANADMRMIALEGFGALRPVDHGATDGAARPRRPSSLRAGSVLAFDGSHSLRYDPISAQVLCDAFPVVAQSFGDLPQVASRLVQLYSRMWRRFADFRPLAPAQFFSREPRGLRLGAHGHSRLAEIFVGGFAVNPDAHRDLFNAQAGSVETDRVAEILLRDYHGPVYDLQTASGHIIAYSGAGKPQYVLSNCRCTVIQLSARDLRRLGRDGPDEAPPVELRDWTNPRTGEVVKVPEGVDPGFGYAPGEGFESRVAEADRLAREKAQGAAPELRAAFLEWLEATIARRRRR